ncbi:interleukin-17C [Myripristis murdjan]|uniref:interleukin-17C n=1 Tax=Myripristis murdjan TaxID=586833 RepID=UPI001175DA45|nr:interleukin-17C [Myripristis murdjan]
MAMIQILLVGFLLVPVLTSNLPCFNEDELEDKASRKLSRYHQPLDLSAVLPSEAGTPVCPVDLYPQSAGPNDRSLSPWRYIRDTDKDRFPPTIAVAQCLCEGCITSKGKEDMDYNSYLIEQSRVVLRKELCDDGKKYRLVPDSVKVGVGCTCLKSKST